MASGRSVVIVAYIFSAVLLVLAVYTTIDAARFPAWAFKRARVSKMEYTVFPLLAYVGGLLLAFLIHLPVGTVLVLWLSFTWISSAKGRVRMEALRGRSLFGTPQWSPPSAPTDAPAAPPPWETRDWSQPQAPAPRSPAE